MKSFIFGLFIFGTTITAAAQSASQHNMEVAKQLDIFNNLYITLDQYYVDTLSAEKNINNAILYLLNQLDPYTEYYTEKQSKDFKQLTTGKYAGIGSVISYNPTTKRCIINDPYQYMPAAQAGLQIGDVILAINGKDVGVGNNDNWQDYSNDISNKLKGDAGTTLTLKVKRFGVDKPLTFTITRRLITLPVISISKMLNDTTGYIALNSFNDRTYEDMKNTFLELKEKGMKNLILDLRGNPGGLLREAIKVVSMFVPRGKTVVSTKGKIKDFNNVYKTQNEPLDLSIPIVVITNKSTASAAEIVSGALQDYDRAIVIGTRTYGKGLVQEPRELPYNTLLKLTTSKYYIPSGRCIQAYSYKDGYPVHLPDSIAKVFHTAGGRRVLDSGGITPDIKIKSDSVPNLLSDLLLSDALRNYCSNYFRHHRKIAIPEKFHLSDEEYNEMKKFLFEHKFTYDNDSKTALQILKGIAQKEGYGEAAQEEFDKLEKKLVHNYDFDFEHWKPQIKQLVEGEIIKRYYYHHGLLSHNLQSDKEVKKALELLANSQKYYQILSIHK